MKHTQVNNEESGSGALTSFAIGILVGAAAVVLSKKDNRKKIQTKMNELFEMGQDRMHDAEDTFEDLKTRGRNTLKAGLDQLQDQVESVETEARKVNRKVRK